MGNVYITIDEDGTEEIWYGVKPVYRDGSWYYYVDPDNPQKRPEGTQGMLKVKSGTKEKFEPNKDIKMVVLKHTVIAG